MPTSRLWGRKSRPAWTEIVEVINALDVGPGVIVVDWVAVEMQLKRLSVAGGVERSDLTLAGSAEEVEHVLTDWAGGATARLWSEATGIGHSVAREQCSQNLEGNP